MYIKQYLRDKMTRYVNIQLPQIISRSFLEITMFAAIIKFCTPLFDISLLDLCPENISRECHGFNWNCE